MNAGIEGGAASAPNIAASTVDTTNMRSNASVGVYAAEAGYSGFVVTEAGTKGLQYSSASLLVATFTAGSAWVVKTSVSPDNTIRVTKASTWTVNLTALSDNYVWIKADGSVGVATTTVGGAAPTLPTDTLGLSKVETDGSTVTGTPTDISPSSAGSLPAFFRSQSCWPVPTSTTVLSLKPGRFEVNGLSVNLTAQQSLNITTAANFVAGGIKSNSAVYFLVANNSGSPKYALTSSTPSAVSIVGGATTGTDGIKQFRTVSGLVYRYMGGWPVRSTPTMFLGQRAGRDVYLHSIQHLGTTTDATSYTSTTTVKRFAPRTAKAIHFNFANNRNTKSRARASTFGNGQYINGANGADAGEMEIPLGTNGEFFYLNPTGSGDFSMQIAGWLENLD